MDAICSFVYDTMYDGPHGDCCNQWVMRWVHSPQGSPGVLRLQSLGYGGVLCLAAVALRASFSGEDVHSHGPMASCYLVLKHGLLEHLPFTSMIFSSGSPDTEGYLQYPKEVHEGLGHCLWLSLPDPHGDLHALQLGLRAIQQL